MGMRPGRGVAYVGAVAGALVSTAANVAHTFVPPAGVTPGWRPPVGAVIGATFWPFAVLIALEILARVDWPDQVRWALVRFGGLAPVALVAAFVSYRHMSGLLVSWHEDPITSAVGPLAVDGLMVMASGALLATRPRVDQAPTVEVEDPTWSRLQQAIRDELLPARPSAEAIRKHLHIGASAARALRDRLRPAPIDQPTEG